MLFRGDSRQEDAVVAGFTSSGVVRKQHNPLRIIELHFAKVLAARWLI
jgi:hypothetical protein